MYSSDLSLHRETPMRHYTVHLECPGLPMNRRIQAEVRFAKSLDRALGGPGGVVAACAAWQSASEDSSEEPSPEMLAALRRWQRAADAARQAGLQEVGEAEEAYFEVRLVESAEPAESAEAAEAGA